MRHTQDNSMCTIKHLLAVIALWAVSPAVAVATTDSQVPFIQNPFRNAPISSDSESNGNFTTMSLSSLSFSTFTTLTHPDFPLHSLRIKKAPKDWCDPSVDKYTGYVDISPAKHLFFYFFESRSNPDEDDVVLWTNGGPGGSSTMGLFMELGPCKVHGNETEVNPYSWNELSNIFFIDQPIGERNKY